MSTASNQRTDFQHPPSILDHTGAFEGLRDAVVLSDKARHVVWVNPAFTALTGFDLADLAGEKIIHMFADADGRFSEEATPVRPCDPDQIQNKITLCRHITGRSIRSHTTTWAIADQNGDIIGHATMIRDMGAALSLQAVMAKLYEISASQILCSQEKIHAILRIGCEYFHLPTARVSAVQGQIYKICYAVSTICDVPPGTEYDLTGLICAETIQADRPITTCDRVTVLQNRQASSDSRLNERAYIGMPLTVDGQRIGTVCFSSPMARGSFSEDEKDLIKLLAAWVSQELRLISAQDKLKLAASTDWLTSTSTRRHFHEDVQTAYAEFEQSGRVSSVIMLDIDHFKAVNDTYGHATGDLVLKSVAGALREELSLGTTLYRVGGEEFALLLRDTGSREALEVAENMRGAVGRINLQHPRGAIRVSVSLGAATLHKDIKDAKAWLYHADAALYASKNCGRNRVSSAGVDNVLDFFGSSRTAQPFDVRDQAEAGQA